MKVSKISFSFVPNFGRIFLKFSSSKVFEQFLIILKILLKHFQSLEPQSSQISLFFLSDLDHITVPKFSKHFLTYSLKFLLNSFKFLSKICLKFISDLKIYAETYLRNSLQVSRNTFFSKFLA